MSADNMQEIVRQSGTGERKRLIEGKKGSTHIPTVIIRVCHNPGTSLSFTSGMYALNLLFF